MPRGNKTGPDGQGPMTGRGLGYCAGYPTPGYATNAPGKALGRGYGTGKGLGLGFRGGRGRGYHPYSSGPSPYSVPSKEEELNILKAQTENLKKGLEEIQKSISELGTQEGKPKQSN